MCISSEPLSLVIHMSACVHVCCCVMCVSRIFKNLAMIFAHETKKKTKTHSSRWIYLYINRKRAQRKSMVVEKIIRKPARWRGCWFGLQRGEGAFDNGDCTCKEEVTKKGRWRVEGRQRNVILIRLQTTKCNTITHVCTFLLLYVHHTDKTILWLSREDEGRRRWREESLTHAYDKLNLFFCFVLFCFISSLLQRQTVPLHLNQIRQIVNAYAKTVETESILNNPYAAIRNERSSQMARDRRSWLIWKLKNDKKEIICGNEGIEKEKKSRASTINLRNKHNLPVSNNLKNTERNSFFLFFFFSYHLKCSFVLF